MGPHFSGESQACFGWNAGHTVNIPVRFAVQTSSLSRKSVDFLFEMRPNHSQDYSIIPAGKCKHFRVPFPAGADIASDIRLHCGKIKNDGFVF
ncbi:MAG: hypothetical protein ABF449_12175 [Ethanoligenens sp.]